MVNYARVGKWALIGFAWWLVGAGSTVFYFRYVQTTYIQVEKVDLEKLVGKFNEMVDYAHTLEARLRSNPQQQFMRETL